MITDLLKLSDEQIRARKMIKYTKDEYECINAHIARHFGRVCQVIYDPSPVDPQIDLVVVSPSDNRDFYTVITRGMGAYIPPLTTKQKRYPYPRSELIITLDKNWLVDSRCLELDVWPLRLLLRLCHYPYAKRKLMTPGMLFDNGKPFIDDITFQGVLVDELDSSFSGVDSNCILPNYQQVHFMQITTLHLAELRFIEKFGLAKFYAAINYRPLTLTINRPCFIKPEELYSTNIIFDCRWYEGYLRDRGITIENDLQYHHLAWLLRFCYESDLLTTSFYEQFPELECHPDQDPDLGELFLKIVKTKLGGLLDYRFYHRLGKQFIHNYVVSDCFPDYISDLENLALNNYGIEDYYLDREQHLSSLSLPYNEDIYRHIRSILKERLRSFTHQELVPDALERRMARTLGTFLMCQSTFYPSVKDAAPILAHLRHASRMNYFQDGYPVLIEVSAKNLYRILRLASVKRVDQIRSCRFQELIEEENYRFNERGIDKLINEDLTEIVGFRKKQGPTLKLSYGKHILKILQTIADTAIAKLALKTLIPIYEVKHELLQERIMDYKQRIIEELEEEEDESTQEPHADSSFDLDGDNEVDLELATSFKLYESQISSSEIHEELMAQLKQDLQPVFDDMPIERQMGLLVHHYKSDKLTWGQLKAHANELLKFMAEHDLKQFHASEQPLEANQENAAQSLAANTGISSVSSAIPDFGKDLDSSITSGLDALLKVESAFRASAVGSAAVQSTDTSLASILAAGSAPALDKEPSSSSTNETYISYASKCAASINQATQSDYKHATDSTATADQATELDQLLVPEAPASADYASEADKILVPKGTATAGLATEADNILVPEGTTTTDQVTEANKILVPEGTATAGLATEADKILVPDEATATADQATEADKILVPEGNAIAGQVTETDKILVPEGAPMDDQATEADKILAAKSSANADVADEADMAYDAEEGEGEADEEFDPDGWFYESDGLFFEGTDELFVRTGVAMADEASAVSYIDLKSIYSDFDFTTKPLLLAHLPIRKPYESFGYLPYLFPSAELNVARTMDIAMGWYHDFGALPVYFGADMVEFMVAEPLDELDARQIACELIALSSKIRYLVESELVPFNKLIDELTGAKSFTVDFGDVWRNSNRPYGY